MLMICLPCVVGLMLYSGHLDDGSGDFISFGMRNRRAEFRLDVGSGPAVVTSEPLELERWHTVRIRRDRKDGTALSFYHAMLCISMAYAVARCPSVCLFVCLSHASIVSKRPIIFSNFFHHFGSSTILILTYQTLRQYSDWDRLTVASNIGGVKKIAIF